MLKLIPSIILTIFTGFLIVELYKAEERSARLKNGGPNGAMAAPSNRAPQVRLQVVHSIDKGCFFSESMIHSFHCPKNVPKTILKKRF